MSHYSNLVFACIMSLVLTMLIPVAYAMPVDFNATPRSGNAPLTVAFTDESTGGPLNNWSWYFGDENYSSPWTLVNLADAPWSASTSGRSFMGIATLPNGTIVLTGGYTNTSIGSNETWRSVDNGKSWELMNASSGWLPRYSHSMVALSDGSLVLMGGHNSTTSSHYNDTWRSTDDGGNWTLMNANSSWQARHGQSVVAMSDDSIILMGGEVAFDPLNDPLGFSASNDTWRSTDKGGNWTLMNASPGWSSRWRMSAVGFQNQSIVPDRGNSSH